MLLRRVSYSYPGAFGDILKTLLSGRFIHGKETHFFESLYSENLNNQSCVTTSYGVHALDLILKYYKLDLKGLVLVPVYTASVVLDLLKIRKVNYKLVDIDPLRGIMCLNDFKSKLDSDVSAIIHTHLFGNVANSEILKICRERDITIIEDCAHAHGSTYNGKPVGTLGDAAFFSFDYSKLINTYTGGVLTSPNSDLIQYARNQIESCSDATYLRGFLNILSGQFERILSFKSLSILTKAMLKYPLLVKKLKGVLNSLSSNRGTSVINFTKFSNFKAIVGLSSLKSLNLYLKTRQDKIDFLLKSLREEFEHLKSSLGDVPYYLIIIVDDVQWYRMKLLEKGIDVGTGEEIMQDLSLGKEFHGKDFALKHYLQIPIHHKLQERDLEHIASSLLELKKLK